MIQKININKFYGLGFDRIQTTLDQLGKHVALPLRKIVNTTDNFLMCVKDCFLAKNTDGFCFDQKNCQPLMMDPKASKNARLCDRLNEWKKKGGELCDCSAKAGLGEVKNYCPMLHALAGKRGKGGHKGPRSAQ